MDIENSFSCSFNARTMARACGIAFDSGYDETAGVASGFVVAVDDDDDAGAARVAGDVAGAAVAVGGDAAVVAAVAPCTEASPLPS